MSYFAYASQFDAALLALYAFYALFVVLIMYLRNEDRREGYPLLHEHYGTLKVVAARGAPKPKIWPLRYGAPAASNTVERDMAGLLSPIGNKRGEPYAPLGNPLQDGVGTASYALRADVPDLTYDDNVPRIIPLRAAPDYGTDEEDPDPRGWTVVAADGVAVGLITDLWVDKSDHMFRYLEASVQGPAGRRAVVFPMGYGDFDAKRQTVTVSALLSHQFIAAPSLKHADTITLREEDMVSGYFAGGALYATPARSEPFL
jgi:photosynthetic reaction center H subunit